MDTRDSFIATAKVRDAALAVMLKDTDTVGWPDLLVRVLKEGAECSAFHGEILFAAIDLNGGTHEQRRISASKYSMDLLGDVEGLWLDRDGHASAILVQKLGEAWRDTICEDHADRILSELLAFPYQSKEGFTSDGIIKKSSGRLLPHPQSVVVFQ